MSTFSALGVSHVIALYKCTILTYLLTFVGRLCKMLWFEPCHKHMNCVMLLDVKVLIG